MEEEDRIAEAIQRNNDAILIEEVFDENNFPGGQGAADEFLRGEEVDRQEQIVASGEDTEAETADERERDDDDHHDGDDHEEEEIEEQEEEEDEERSEADQDDEDEDDSDDSDHSQEDNGLIMNEEQRQLAAAAGAAAAEAIRVPVQAVKIPLFYGDKTDTMTAEQWANTIDRARDLHNWDDAQSAAAATENFRGSANMWRENLTMGNADQVAAATDWEAMKTLFLQQFGETTLPTQKVDLMLGLKQQKDETAKTFYVRVDNALKKISKTALAATPEAQKPGFIRCRENMQQFVFMAGLKAEVRKWVTASMPDNPTLDNLRQAAIKADQAEFQKLSAAVHNLAEIQNMAAMRSMGMQGGEDQIAQDRTFRRTYGGSHMNAGPSRGFETPEQELAALRAQNRQLTAGGKQKQTGGQQQGGARQKESQNVKAIPMAERGWILCYNCHQWGQHFKHECQVPKEEAKKLVKQTARDKPQGAPHDSQYPN